MGKDGLDPLISSLSSPASYIFFLLLELQLENARAKPRVITAARLKAWSQLSAAVNSRTEVGNEK